MEKKEKKPNYQKIPKDDNIIPKKYHKINTNFMSNFNKGKDIIQDNSMLKYNQVGVIEKYGLLYFYNESGIYFIDNSKLKILKVVENKDISYTDLFFLKCDDVFNVFQIEEKEKIFLIICTKNNKEYSFLIYISIEKLIEAMNSAEKIYDINIIEKLEEKEKLFSKGYFTRAIDELEPNIELNEEGVYEEQPLIKKLTPEEKLNIFMKEKNEEFEERNECFENNYKKSKIFEFEKVIYLDQNFEEIIILDYDNYLVRYNNGDIIFYKNYQRTRIVEKKALKMSYNRETNIFLILTKEELLIFKEKDSFTIFEEINNIKLKNILQTSLDEEIIIHIENIYNFLILYTIENNENPENPDKIYFLQMNSRMDDIIKIYLEEKYFYVDDNELEGIAYEGQKRRTVFTIYDKDINVYFVNNKHMDLSDKYYGFKKINEDTYDIIHFELNDDEKLNSRIPGLDKFEDNENIKKLETNPYIGICIIKFKFDSYNDDTEMINNQEFLSPYLMIVLGYYGGFKVFHILNEVQEKEGKIEYKLKEQTELFKKTQNISNKSLRIKINDEIAETEKEKFLYDSKKKESLKEMLNRKKINTRNIFLHDLDLQIKENLNKIKTSAYSEKIKVDLIKLGELAKNKIFEEMEKSINDLIKNAEELFNSEEENQMFIKTNKEITEKNKNLEINIKNQIKQLEEDKNKFKELFLNMNSPINLILTHQKMKNLFGENEVNFMINFFNKIKTNINLFQNHTNLIGKINEINSNLIKNIEICKKNYISKKEYDCLKKRKDFEDVKRNIQNKIFVMYMSSFCTYFFDLSQFKEKEMAEELNNLNELKRKYYLKHNFGDQDEEKNEDNMNMLGNSGYRKRRKKFLLKEEDIDEGNYDNNGNDNISINNISNLSQSNSLQNKEQRLVLANNAINNYDYNNNKEVLIEREKDAIVNKLFNMNLVKEKNFTERNKLSEILSHFEGRVTIYDESTEDETCITADELFSDLLKDEEEIKRQEQKAKALKAKAQKEKEKKINYIKKSLEDNKKERDKIEEELKKIDDEKKAEIIEKEKQVQQLKSVLDEVNKKYQENLKEREKEKKIYKEEIEKRSNEGQRQINEEKNKNEEIIKKMEKEIQEYKNKLLQEEQKRKEIEEKNKKLEQEKNSNNSPTRIQPSFNIVNTNDNKDINDTQNQNKFLRNTSNNKVNEKKDNEEDKSKDLFNVKFKPEESINNVELFTSNRNNNDNNNKDNIQNLFKTTTNSNINIFSSINSGENNKKGIFNNNSNNSNSQNVNQNQNLFNQPKNNDSNNVFGNFNNNNINKNNQPSNNLQNPSNNTGMSLIGQNISFPNNLGNQGQTNNLFGQNLGYGQHRSLGPTNDGNKNETTITYSFPNIQKNNNNNRTSLFASISGGGFLGNNTNNQNTDQNQDNYF